MREYTMREYTVGGAPGRGRSSTRLFVIDASGDLAAVQREIRRRFGLNLSRRQRPTCRFGLGRGGD